MLLRYLVDAFDVVPADVDEVAPRALPVGEALEVIARKKALHVSQRRRDAWVLAADTVVAWGDELVGKARSEPEVRERLALLAGSTHQVWTGLAVAWNGLVQDAAHAVTAVHMDRMPRDAVDAYVRSGHWEGKAGGYGIQDPMLGAYLRIQSGPWSNVVGLPLAATRDLLRRNGVVCKDPPTEEWMVANNPFAAAAPPGTR